MRAQRFATAACVLALLAGCSDSSAPPATPTTIQLSHAALSLADGDTARLSATVLDQNGSPMQALPGGLTLTWSSSAPAVAGVQQGLVTAQRRGSAQVVAEAGAARAVAEVTVTPVPTATERAAGDGQRAAAGTAVADSLGVRVVDRHGEGVGGVSVAFAVTGGGGAVSPASAVTGADGVARAAWTLGRLAGAQSVAAVATGLTGHPVSFQAAAVAGAPAELRRLSGDAQTGSAGAALERPLVVQVLDAHGNPAAGAEVLWQVVSGGGSVSPARAAADTAGRVQTLWTLGAAQGTQTVTATVAELSPAPFTASIGAATASAPVISSVEPATLTPGGTATIHGRNFGAVASDVRVTIAGAGATVSQISDQRLVVTVPAAGALPCGAGGARVAVSVGAETATRDHPLRTATPRSIAVGQMVSLPAAELRCNQLPAGAGRYLISVSSQGAVAANVTGFELRASSAAVAAAASSTAARASLSPVRSAAAALDPTLYRADVGHGRMLDTNRETVRRLGMRLPQRSGVAASRAAATLPQVGDTLSFNIPRLGSGMCTNYAPVRARAVFVGEQAIIFEDVAAPLAGQMDAAYRAVGREFEESMMPVLRANFGNPLAVDRLTDNNGRLYMLFSKQVNDDPGGAAGFVYTGDFYPTTSCEGSNRAEIFYARVPTTTGAGYSANTVDYWNWTMRSTIIHEVKHLTSFAERLNNPEVTALEESWLEESTARVSEELWARSVYGYGARGNVGHQASVYCESRPSVSDCLGRPLIVRKHFSGLYDYLAGNGTLSPLGRVREGDGSFYGSGWSLVRWILDHATTSEAQFLLALTREPKLSGIRNLEARSGRTYAEMHPEWALALALDDRPGFTPASARLSFPSWNLRDVYAGLNRDFSGVYSVAAPMAGRAVSSDGSVTPAQLRDGAAAVFEVASGSDAMLLELRGPGATATPGSLRASIVRVQ